MTILQLKRTISNAAKVSDAVTIAGLSTLASGAYGAPSALIDNTPGNAYGLSFTRGMLRLSFAASLTAGTSAPSVTAYLLRAADGSTLPTPPGAAASAPAPNAAQAIRQLAAGAAFQVLDFPAFDLDPDHYAVQILNGTGVAFSGTVTLTLYRWTLQEA